MTVQLTSGAGYFQVNDGIYPRGGYRMVLKQDLVGLSEREGLPVVAPTLFSDWIDNTSTPYATRQDLIDDLRNSIYI